MLPLVTSPAVPAANDEDDGPKQFTAYPVRNTILAWRACRRKPIRTNISVCCNNWICASWVCAGMQLLTTAVIATLVLFAIFAVRQALERAEMYRGLQLYQDLNLPDGTIPLLMPVYSRPNYLERSLEALRKASNVEQVRFFAAMDAHAAAVLSIVQTVLIVSQDGTNPDIAALIASVDFMHVIHLRHNPPYFGIPSWFLRTDAPTAANVYFLLRTAFEYLNVRAAIVLESDLLLSVDGLDYFEWAYNQVKRNPKLEEQVFTINGYYENSRDGFGDAFSMTTDDYGFMVWGWLCPDFSWPLIRDGWTWFGNWDITLEYSVRQPSGKVSLSPTISRSVNIGMKGINFDINDPSEVRKWEELRTITTPVDYSEQHMRVYKSEKEWTLPPS